MSKGTNQKLKFMYLLKIMLEKTDDEHSISMSEIVNELAKYDVTAERKSIYSDFADFEKFDVEVIGGQRGRNYGYHVGKRYFELAEIKLLIDAIQSSKFITEKKSNELIKKIKMFVSENNAKQLQRQVYVHGRIKTMNESIYYSVDSIHNAIAEDKKIRFQYCEWNIRKELVPKHEGKYYEVSPWALTWDDENYYLIGYDSDAGKIKHYRVDKMIQISPADSRRDGKNEFPKIDLAAYAKQSFGMYGGETKSVILEFPNEKCGIFIDRFGKDINFQKVDSCHSRTMVSVAVSNQFLGWIFGLGRDVKIVGPDDVVARMKDYLKEIALNY